jgi:hypothetical protein
LFLVSPSIHAQAPSRQNLEASCHKFVQEFYNWYIKEWDRAYEAKTSPWALAIRHRRAEFSPELLRLLHWYARLPATDDDEVGLDFDLFGAGQDTPNRYVAGNVIPRNGRYLVEVWSNSAPPPHSEASGKKAEEPTVTPELVFRDGHWVFVNFHYGKDADLVGMLKQLQIEQRKSAKSTHSTPPRGPGL